MEFKNIKINIFYTILIGLLLGLIYYYIPKSYHTTGSLYITRKTEQNSSEYFKYEGYYGQQAAITYTESVLSILESTDIQSKTISNMNITVNKINLLKLKKDISIKKAGPQIITVTAKANNPQKSNDIWNNLVNISIKEIEDINTNYGDSNLKINKIGQPVTTQNYFPLYICLGLGVGISFFVYLIIVFSINNQKFNYIERK